MLITRTIFIGLLMFILLDSLVAADTLRGMVINVTDGDTITVLDDDKQQFKIRLQSIDAPESGQSYGNVAKQHLSQLVFNKLVTVIYTKRDRYGRIIGKVQVRGQDANLQQVQNGLAWHYKTYANEQLVEDRSHCAIAEVDDRAVKRGLWHDTISIPPWDWRKGIRNTSAAMIPTVTNGT